MRFKVNSKMFVTVKYSCKTINIYMGQKDEDGYYVE